MPVPLPVGLSDLTNVVPGFKFMALHADRHAVFETVIAAELIGNVVIELDAEREVAIAALTGLEAVAGAFCLTAIAGAFKGGALRGVRVRRRPAT